MAEYGFEFTLVDIDATYFEVFSPRFSDLRDLHKVERLSFNVFSVLDKPEIQIELKAKSGKMIISQMLGFPDGTKTFLNVEDTVTECVRLAMFRGGKPPSLIEKKGECVVCLDEKDVLELECHPDHTLCNRCFIEIFIRHPLCPLCRVPF
jgi:hypothetical protein